MSYTCRHPVWQALPRNNPLTLLAAVQLFSELIKGKILVLTSSISSARRVVASHPEATMLSRPTALGRISVAVVHELQPQSAYDLVICEMLVPSDSFGLPAWRQVIEALQVQGVVVVERQGRRWAPTHKQARQRAEACAAWVNRAGAEVWDSSDDKKWGWRRQNRNSWPVPALGQTTPPFALCDEYNNIDVTNVEEVDYTAGLDMALIRATADMMWVEEGRQYRRVQSLEAWAGEPLSNDDVLAELKAWGLRTLRCLYEPDYARNNQVNEMHLTELGHYDQERDDEDYALERKNFETRRELFMRVLTAVGWAEAAQAGQPILASTDDCNAIREALHRLFETDSWLAADILGHRSSLKAAIIEDKTGRRENGSIVKGLLTDIGYRPGTVAEQRLPFHVDPRQRRFKTTVWYPRVLKKHQEQPADAVTQQVKNPNPANPANAGDGILYPPFCSKDQVQSADAVTQPANAENAEICHKVGPPQGVEPELFAKNPESGENSHIGYYNRSFRLIPENLQIDQVESSGGVQKSDKSGCILAFQLDLAAWLKRGPPAQPADGIRRDVPYEAISAHTADGLVSIPDPAKRKPTQEAPRGRKSSTWPTMRKAYIQNLSKSHRDLLRALPGRTLVSMDLHAAHVHIAVKLASSLDHSKAMRSLISGDPYQNLVAKTGCTRAQAKVVLLAAINGGAVTSERLGGASDEVVQAVQTTLKTALAPWHAYVKQLAPATEMALLKEQKERKGKDAVARSRGALEMQAVEASLLEDIIKAVEVDHPRMRLLVTMYDGALWDLAGDPERARFEQTVRAVLLRRGYPDITPVVGVGSTWREAEQKT